MNRVSQHHHPVVLSGIVFLAGVFAFAGCMSVPKKAITEVKSSENQTETQRYAAAAKHLSYVENHVAEWGSGSISNIVLVPDKGQFDIKYDVPTAEYVNKARTALQGSARRSLEKSVDYQAAQQAQVDAEAAVAAAAAPGAGAAAAVASADSTSDTAPAFESKLPMASPAKEVLSSTQFTKALEIGPLPDGVSERSAVLTGVSDKMTERLLTFLSSPKNLPENVDVYFGIFQVSCNPGWRTRRHYLADIGVTLEYGRDAVKLEDASEDLAMALDQLGKIDGAIYKTLQAVRGELSKAIVAASAAHTKTEKESAAAAVDALKKSEKSWADLWGTSQSLVGAIEGLSSSNEDTINAGRIEGAALAIEEFFGGLTTGQTDAIAAATAKDYGSDTFAARDAFLGFARDALLALAQAKTTTATELSYDDYYSKMNGGEAPTVIGIFPLHEAQTLNLRNSERGQMSFLTFLASVFSGAGQKGQSEQILSAVRRLETDAATRTPIPLVSSYTNGYTFGFQFQPAFQALGNPAEKKEGSQQVLQPYSFPAMIIVACEKSSVWSKDNPDGWSYINTSVNLRWVPLVKDRPFYRRPMGMRRDSTDRQVGVAAELDQARTLIYQGSLSGSMVAMELERRIRGLESAGIGLTSINPLPEFPVGTNPAPTVSDVQPRNGFANAETVLVIKGKDLSTVKEVIVGGRRCQAVAVGGKAVVAVVPALALKGNTAPQIVTVVSAGGAVESESRVTFDIVAEALPPPTISVSMDNDGNLTGITINRDGKSSVPDGLSGRELLETIRSILEKKSPRLGIDGVEVTLKGK